MSYFPCLTKGEITKLNTVINDLKHAEKGETRTVQILDLLKAQEQLTQLIHHVVSRGL